MKTADILAGFESPGSKSAKSENCPVYTTATVMALFSLNPFSIF